MSYARSVAIGLVVAMVVAGDPRAEADSPAAAEFEEVWKGYETSLEERSKELLEWATKKEEMNDEEAQSVADDFENLHVMPHNAPSSTRTEWRNSQKKVRRKLSDMSRQNLDVKTRAKVVERIKQVDEEMKTLPKDGVYEYEYPAQKDLGKGKKRFVRLRDLGVDENGEHRLLLTLDRDDTGKTIKFDGEVKWDDEDLTWKGGAVEINAADPNIPRNLHISIEALDFTHLKVMYPRPVVGKQTRKQYGQRAREENWKWVRE